MKLTRSYIERLARMSPRECARVVEEFSDAELTAIFYDWKLSRRPSQRLPRGHWTIWLIETGRGFGKTRTGAETIREWHKCGYTKFNLVGRTIGDVRDTMLEGESGLLNIFPPHERPTYVRSRKKVCWRNGAEARLFSDEEPDHIRGSQCEKAWADEASSFKNLNRSSTVDGSINDGGTWSNLMFALRLGRKPQVIVTTTPKTRRAYREIFHSAKKRWRIVRTTGSSYENFANLARDFINNIIGEYKGTRLGQQEIYGLFTENLDGTLWNLDMIERYKVDDIRLDSLKTIAVAIDPSVTYTENSNETGIVAGGLDKRGHAYIIGDHSLRAPPTDKIIKGRNVKGWASVVDDTYDLYDCDIAIGEVNNGGDLVESVITQENANIYYESVRASRGKATRAEPVARLYEKGLVHHVRSAELDDLEDQMVNWVPGEGESPDRVDALVWLLTHLKLDKGMRSGSKIVADRKKWEGLFYVN